LTFLIPIALHAQLDSIATEKINSLFSEWNVPNHPGGAVAISKNGKTVYSKAFGLASLEYLVPNSTGTIFNTGSVSKQFTAMGIVVLEENGRLSFDDDIRKHIPELPDFGQTITIRHLLHHTSGLRSLHALFALAGWRGDDSRTNADLNRIILNQKELNFEPGSEYLYCNTGYMLMVNIIEKVTGEKFKVWMKEKIFNELGMHHTYVEDKYSRVVANNATSYYAGKTFERAVEYWGYVGSGNMHSTTADLLTWLSNFNNPQKGWESAFKKMQTVDPLNDGNQNNYAFGVNVDNFLGEKRIRHGGAIGGFRAHVATYPNQNLSVVILTNFSRGNPGGHSDEIAKIVIGNKNVNEPSQSEMISINIPNETLKKFEGTFWNNKEKYGRKIYLNNDTLRYSRNKTNESPLVPLTNSTFQMLNVGVNLIVKFDVKDDEGQMTVTIENEPPSAFQKIKTSDSDDSKMSEYVGQYYSTEVETSYTIELQNDEVSIYHPRHGSMPMKQLFHDTFSADWPIGVVQIQRNNDKAVKGILISNGRVRNLWFEKQ